MSAERVHRYADAVRGWGINCEDFDADSAARAAMAVADVEVAHVSDRMQAALDAALVANVDMAEANAERLHRSVQREKALRDRVARIEALHRLGPNGFDCECCETMWPCPTAEALAEEPESPR